MNTHRIPRGMWDWKYSVLVLALIAAPLALVLQLVPDLRSLPDAAGATSVLACAAVVAAAVFVYVAWRLTGTPAAGWLALVLALLGTQGLVLAGATVADPGLVAEQAGWVLLAQLPVALGAIALLVGGPARELRLDPLLLGVLVGAAIAFGRSVLLDVAPPLSLADGALPGLAVAGLVLHLGVAVGALRLTGIDQWLRSRLALASVLLGAGLATGRPRAEGLVDSVATIGFGLLGAAVLCSAALAMLRRAIWDDKAQLADLHDRLESVEAVARRNRARLHEIDSTVAGIASATRLLHTPLAEARRGALEGMMQAEVERLERLLRERAGDDRRAVDLDEVVGQLVLSHRARGRTVSWLPSGLTAWGRSDDVAEVVNILLDNAAKHGGDLGTFAEVRAAGPHVEIVVTDSGPGVPPEWRDRIFEWGQRGPASQGQGIGLHIAHDLCRQLGGSLRLEHHDAAGSGATFVVSLPVPAESEVRHAAHAAQ
ncbi:sensor histidine kinase [Nocardioides sp. SYSU D00038]|uniref:sensor histidine kinase n=1 Tax=Nocardioides sp. SYSU D00038 TaxID=2812554 RepID=UPI001966F981|nr:sensor histidine kinase [Nocardioides sp. SYSU D00038]